MTIIFISVSLLHRTRFVHSMVACTFCIHLLLLLHMFLSVVFSPSLRCLPLVHSSIGRKTVVAIQQEIIEQKLIPEHTETYTQHNTQIFMKEKSMYSHKFPFKPVLKHFNSISIFTLFVLHFFFAVRFWAMCVFEFFFLCYCFCGCGCCCFAFVSTIQSTPSTGKRTGGSVSSSSSSYDDIHTHYYFYWIKKPYLRA